MHRRIIAIALVATVSFSAAALQAAEPTKVLELSKRQVPSPPWPAGDELGMGNAIGRGTWARCAWHLEQPSAKAYEVSRLRSNTMPLSPFVKPYAVKATPTHGAAGTTHAFNGEELQEGEPAQQGTQMDALGHFAYLQKPWNGTPPFPADDARYYGGYSQKDVKPTPDSPLVKLGIDKAPPLITTAVLLDARTHVGGGQPLKAGEIVTAKHIEAMLEAQGLSRRGVLPGDVVFVHTGWGDHWKDPDTEKFYYTKAPGLSYDAAQYLGEKRVVAVALDAPFIDAVPEGMLAGKAAPAPGTPAGQVFPVHHQLLTQLGIHLVENAKLDEMARDKVWTSCTMILPVRDKGAAGSAVRPVAIGVPQR